MFSRLCKCQSFYNLKERSGLQLHLSIVSKYFETLNEECKSCSTTTNPKKITVMCKALNNILKLFKMNKQKYSCNTIYSIYERVVKLFTISCTP